MKKLMIALAVVACAAAVEAAQVNWKCAKSSYVYAPGGEAKAVGTAYVFDANDTAGYTRDTLIQAFASTTGIDYSKALGDSFTLTESGTFNQKFNSTAEHAYNLFVVVKADDGIYVSELVPATGPTDPEGLATAAFSPSDNSTGAFQDASMGFQNAGWYQTVPEPTSGLLLLLGVAGLALRRRRA